MTLVIVLAIADGLPGSYNHNCFSDVQRPGVAEAFRLATASPLPDLATQSVSRGLAVSDSTRKSIRIRDRRATSEEARYLRMPPKKEVFEVDVLNVDAGGRQILFGRTMLRLSRIEFVWDFQEA